MRLQNGLKVLLFHKAQKCSIVMLNKLCSAKSELETKEKYLSKVPPRDCCWWKIRVVKVKKKKKKLEEMV